jgi:subtilisin family serine protease
MPHVEGRIIAKPKDSSDPSEVHAAIVGLATGIDRNIDGINVLVIHAPEPRREEVIAQLEDTGLFDFVENDLVGSSSAVIPNDPFLGNEPWALLCKFQSPSDSLGAWDITIGSALVIVAVIDSGCDGTHPDLASKAIAGYNVLTATNIPPGAQSDNGGAQGHGTAVSGVVCAATNNGVGIAGSAWLSPLMPVVARQAGTGLMNWSDLQTALVWATDHGAKVINMSIAGGDSSSLETALKYAYDHGVVLFGAAGNGATSAPQYPAKSPYVISVGATDGNDALCTFSNFGGAVDLYAPGCLSTVYTTQLGGSYGYWQGTSVSCPIVAGAAALALAIAPTLKPADIKALLLANSDSIGPGIRLNARRFLVAVQSFSPGPDVTPPTVSISSPANGATVSGTIVVTGSATDNVGVTGLQFLVGVSIIGSGGTGPGYSFSWDTTTVPNGNYTLTVKAVDAAGNSGSAQITVTVANSAPPPDTTPPVVTIISPLTGTRVSKPISISVRATDNVGVVRITAYVDLVQIGSTVVSGSPASASFNWNPKKATSGTHTITAKAMDAAGNTGSSASVTVTK